MSDKDILKINNVWIKKTIPRKYDYFLAFIVFLLLYWINKCKAIGNTEIP